MNSIAWDLTKLDGETICNRGLPDILKGCIYYNKDMELIKFL